MATVSVPTIGLLRHDVPLDDIEYIAGGVLVRVTFPEGRTKPGAGELGSLPTVGLREERVLQMAGDRVYVFAEKEEMEKHIEGIKERAAELQRQRQTQSVSGLALPTILPGR